MNPSLRRDAAFPTRRRLGRSAPSAAPRLLGRPAPSAERFLHLSATRSVRVLGSFGRRSCTSPAVFTRRARQHRKGMTFGPRFARVGGKAHEGPKNYNQPKLRGTTVLPKCMSRLSSGTADHGRPHGMTSGLGPPKRAVFRGLWSESLWTAVSSKKAP